MEFTFEGVSVLFVSKIRKCESSSNKFYSALTSLALGYKNSRSRDVDGLDEGTGWIGLGWGTGLEVRETVSWGNCGDTWIVFSWITSGFKFGKGCF